MIDNVDFLQQKKDPNPEGTGKEIVVFLGDGLDIIFDSEGNFQREINVWKEFEENLDAGPKFDAERSSDLEVSVHIKKVNLEVMIILAVCSIEFPYQTQRSQMIVMYRSSKWSLLVI